jgi:hypothetical protein
MNVEQLISSLRLSLVPQGEADIVVLRPTNPIQGFIYSQAEVKALIDELETKMLLASSGIDDSITPLAKLGIRLLLSAAGHPERTVQHDEARIDG